MNHQAILSGRSILGLLAELVLVSAGVFFGLLADQWRESRQHHELAAGALRNFTGEIRANQKAIAAVRSYHEALSHDIQRFLASDGPKTMERFQSSTHFRGIEPVFFEHTGWDLALATQSLSYLRPGLAYAISRVYTQQQAFQTLENSFTQALFNPSTFISEDASAVAQAMQGYLGDVNIQEPALLKSYGELLPQIGNPPESSPGAAKQ